MPILIDRSYPLFLFKTEILCRSFRHIFEHQMSGKTELSEMRYQGGVTTHYSSKIQWLCSKNGVLTPFIFNIVRIPFVIHEE